MKKTGFIQILVMIVLFVFILSGCNENGREAFEPDAQLLADSDSRPGFAVGGADYREFFRAFRSRRRRGERVLPQRGSGDLYEMDLCWQSP